MDLLDKNYVKYTVYSNNTGVITAYTAEWCKLCCRIKEHFSSIFEDYVIIKEGYMPKVEFKLINNLIPYFTKEGSNDGIQTSKEDELVNFINKMDIETMD
jgi:hypothetical protein